jgi:hypothetical protein
MWIALGIVLLVGWLLLKLAWNVATAGVHVLLVLAIIAVAVHFIRGVGRRRGRASPV